MISLIIIMTMYLCEGVFICARVSVLSFDSNLYKYMHTAYITIYITMIYLSLLSMTACRYMTGTCLGKQLHAISIFLAAPSG